MGIIYFIVGAARRRFGGKLISTRVEDETNHVAAVKFVRDKILRQRLGQCWVRRGVSGTEIIDGIDQAAAHEVDPDAVCLGASEERVVRAGEPGGEFVEAV